MAKKKSDESLVQLLKRAREIQSTLASELTISTASSLLSTSQNDFKKVLRQITKLVLKPTLDLYLPKLLTVREGIPNRIVISSLPDSTVTVDDEVVSGALQEGDKFTLSHHDLFSWGGIKAEVKDGVAVFNFTPDYPITTSKKVRAELILNRMGVTVKAEVQVEVLPSDTAHALFMALEGATVDGVVVLNDTKNGFTFSVAVFSSMTTRKLYVAAKLIGELDPTLAYEVRFDATNRGSWIDGGYYRQSGQTIISTCDLRRDATECTLTAKVEFKKKEDNLEVVIPISVQIPEAVME